MQSIEQTLMITRPLILPYGPLISVQSWLCADVDVLLEQEQEHSRAVALKDLSWQPHCQAKLRKTFESV